MTARHRVGEHARQVLDNAAAGDVRNALHLHALHEREHRLT